MQRINTGNPHTDLILSGGFPAHSIITSTGIVVDRRSAGARTVA